MEKFCRACLTKQEDPSKLLLYTEKNRRLFAYSTGLQIKNNGASSCQICKHCYIKMMLACRFKKQSRTSDKRLNHYLSLMENGDATDFATYLEKNDNSFSLKFPLNGSSTSSFRKRREDDNESTCTSIRNFMTDMLCADKVPDTEARIIREMIEQEADVLNDSIDSQWLQDDASVATDFHFSPFSTPRPSKNEYEPQSNSPLKEEQPDEFYFDQEAFTAAKRILLKTPSPCNSLTISKILDPFQNVGYELETCVEVKEEEDILDNVCKDNQEATSAGKKLYVEARDVTEILHERTTTLNKTKDIIDKNIEQALKSSLNEKFSVDALISTPPVQSGGATPLQSSMNKKFPVDALISTPPVQPSVSGASTPLIANILFGDNLNDKTSTAKEHIYCMKSVNSEKPSEVDILEDFFNKETGKYIGEPNEKEINESLDHDVMITSWKIQCGPGKSKYDLSDFSCKVCNRTFGSERSLKIHFFKIHKFKIITPQKISEPRREVACEICGKVFNRLSNLNSHKKRMHLKEKTSHKTKCEVCGIEFSSKRIISHMKTHSVTELKAPAEYKCMCGICGRQFSRESNLKVHIARHNKDFNYICNTCGQGYCRRTELIIHLRGHSGEKPYKCAECYRTFSCKHSLSLHMKKHTGERPYKCSFCKASFAVRARLNFHLKNANKCLRIQEQLQKGDRSPMSVFVEEVRGANEKIVKPMGTGKHNDNNELSIIEEEAESIALESSSNNELPDFKDAENLYDELSDVLKDVK